MPPNTEGLDFIENEGDVVAVESAALKIQSTFRGKKFRSKAKPAQEAASPSSSAHGSDKSSDGAKSKLEPAAQHAEDKLTADVASMQVNEGTQGQVSLFVFVVRLSQLQIGPKEPNSSVDAESRCSARRFVWRRSSGGQRH